MAATGHRHRLVIYTYMLDRWWKTTLAIGLLLIALGAAVRGLPHLLPKYAPLPVGEMALTVLVFAGLLAVCLALLLAIIRRMAHVQPFKDHLRLVTPFLRLKISYRRIRQTSSTEMGQIFQPERSKGRKRRLLGRLSRQTIILLDLTGWPMPPGVLRLFLSPLFFPDRSPRLALLVPDWMAFSNELESLRGTWQGSQRPASGDTFQADLLASLKDKRR